MNGISKFLGPYVTPIEQPVRPKPTFVGTDVIGVRHVGTLVSVTPSLLGRDYIRYDDANGVRCEGTFSRSEWGELSADERRR